MGIIPVILSGGSGTRLWPVSRRSFPKQHAPLFGGESTFQKTLNRVSDEGVFDRPVVITGHGARFMVADQARHVGADPEIILEPEGRDSLGAIAIAAAVAARRGPDAVAIVLSSDHLIPDAAAFAAACQKAEEAARRGGIAVLGLKPARPAENFGYIRPGKFKGGMAPVEAFVEKPDAERAEALIAEGCLWNAGMFCFRADIGRAEIAAHAPETMAAVEEALAGASDDLGAELLSPAFLKAEKTSFDYAVMEKTRRAVVVAADFEWSDIGDWRELWAVSDRDADGVAAVGDVLAEGSRNVYLRSSDRLICALGVEGLAVVDTPDAVLVAPLDRAQEVKGVVATLEESGRPEATEHMKAYRPWGSYRTVDLGERFRVKHIEVLPGKQLSLQKHHHRSEHWVVVSGAAEVTIDGEARIVNENESVYIPVGATHRLANPGKIPVRLIEVQTGSYLEEDDIIRLDDDFGRC